MNLEKISIENFKCFHIKTDIEFGKITLLTGANSSGKSSIIYSILGAIQSGEFPLQFSTNGKYVNMGDFKEISYNHQKENIKLDFTFKDARVTSIQTIWGEDSENKLPKLLELKTDADYFDFSMKYSNKKYSIDIDYNPENSIKFPVDIHTEILKDISDATTVNELNKLLNGIGDSRRIQNSISDNISGDILLIEKPENHYDAIIFGIIVYNISYVFKKYDEQINFISSFRLAPERTYLENTKTKLKVNSIGEGYLDQIILWELRDKKKFNELTQILKDLHLLQTIKSKRLDGGRIEMAVQIKENGILTSLNDVGFGLSQFLPIIVADLQLPKSSTLFVAQPEIHLHPSVQSAFGAYLTQQVKENDKNYVIETHSEYLINKIRLEIVKENIKEEDIKVLFIDNEGDKNVVHKISFNKKGQIIGAPDNFFKTYMMDVMEIAINAMN